MPLFFDNVGQVIPHGKVSRTLEENFLTASALPSWLEASSGTASFDAPSAGFGGCKMTTGSTTNNVARLRTTFTFDPQYFQALWWTVEAFHMDVDDNVWPSFGFINDAGTHAANVYQTSASTAKLQGVGSGTSDIGLHYQIRDADEGTRRRNMTVLWLPQLDEGFFLNDDQVIGYLSGAGFNPVGEVRAFCEITTKENVAHWFKISQCRLTLVHN